MFNGADFPVAKWISIHHFTMSSHGPVNAYGDNGPVVVKFVWSLIGVYTVLLALRTYVRLRLVRQGGLASLILAYVAYVSTDPPLLSKHPRSL